MSFHGRYLGASPLETTSHILYMGFPKCKSVEIIKLGTHNDRNCMEFRIQAEQQGVQRLTASAWASSRCSTSSSARSASSTGDICVGCRSVKKHQSLRSPPFVLVFFRFARCYSFLVVSFPNLQFGVCKASAVQ